MVKKGYVNANNGGRAAIQIFKEIKCRKSFEIVHCSGGPRSSDEIRVSPSRKL